jgi:hypothetical protein
VKRKARKMKLSRPISGYYYSSNHMDDLKGIKTSVGLMQWLEFPNGVLPEYKSDALYEGRVQSLLTHLITLS